MVEIAICKHGWGELGSTESHELLAYNVPRGSAWPSSTRIYWETNPESGPGTRHLRVRVPLAASIQCPPSFVSNVIRVPLYCRSKVTSSTCSQYCTVWWWTHLFTPSWSGILRLFIRDLTVCPAPGTSSVSLRTGLAITRRRAQRWAAVRSRWWQRMNWRMCRRFKAC